MLVKFKVAADYKFSLFCLICY